MTRLCIEHGGVNLAQGFPDFPAPRVLKEAARQAIDDDFNQYATTFGVAELRAAITAKYVAHYGLAYDADAEVTVTCGSTEAMIAALLAVVDPGDEIVVFEPFYENYGPDAILSGATPVYVRLRPPDYGFDVAELRAAVGPRTKAIIVNSPHNPSGHVYTREELEQIAELCCEADCLAITDEIYEHILYDGREHVPLATLPGMRERTITISGLSKTYSVTGWRLAYALAPPELTAAIRKVHDFLTVGAPHPLQRAAVTALQLPAAYYSGLAVEYDERRQLLCTALHQAGFEISMAQGAYYVLADIRPFGFDDDVQFCHWLVREVGVAAVPGSSFFRHPELGRHLARFAFCKKLETLGLAATRLQETRRLAAGRPG